MSVDNAPPLVSFHVGFTFVLLVMPHRAVIDAFHCLILTSFLPQLCPFCLWQVVIGCEGLWGTVLSLLVVYPLAYLAPGQDNGSFEDPFDALAMIGNSKQLTVSMLLT